MTDSISIDDFKKVEIRVGEILSVEPVEGSEKLLKLKVSFGAEERQVVSGIAKHFPDLALLVGEEVCVRHQPSASKNDGSRESGDDHGDRRRPN